MRTACARPLAAPTAEKANSTPPLVSSRTCRDRIARARVDGLGCAELPRDRELLRRDVDRDDPLRPGKARALHDRETDAAAADHGDGRACAHRCRPERRTDARREPAREQARLLDRQLDGHLHRTRLVHDRPVGEGAAAEHRREHGAVHGASQAALRPQLRRAAARDRRAGRTDRRRRARATRRPRGRRGRRPSPPRRSPRRRRRPRGRAGSGTASPSRPSRRRARRCGRARSPRRAPAPRAAPARRARSPRPPAATPGSA